MGDDRLFAVKMRAARAGEHISGAERIVPANDIPALAAALAERALLHAKGKPDEIHLKAEVAADIIHLEALPVSTHVTQTPEEGRACAARLLAGAGITRIDEIMALFPETYGMRGAMLLDADTLERLEPDRARGVRATYMDAAGGGQDGDARKKNHFAEAVVLATKVANAPGIVGEICVSDDPDYVTGYVATKEIGYCRITTIKEMGDPCGGRIFLYRGPREGVEGTIRFLQEQCVLVDNAPDYAPDCPPAPLAPTVAASCDPPAAATSAAAPAPRQGFFNGSGRACRDQPAREAPVCDWAVTSAALPRRALSKAELLAEVMRLRGIDPADAVMVGDTKGDVTSGTAAGMYTIGCTWGYGTREELEGADEIYDAERFD